MASAPPEEAANVVRSPDLPYVSAIVGGLFPGRAIVLTGMVLEPHVSDAKRFNIDLCCGLLIQGDHMDNKALHFNPRFLQGGGWLSSSGADKDVVINSYINNHWGKEERYPNPFEEGKPFQIRILVLEKYFKIAVNGLHLCDYGHRLPVDSIRTILIGGNIRVDLLEFQPPLEVGPNGLQMCPPPEVKDEEVVTMDRPDVPFAFPLSGGGFTAPRTARVIFTPLASASRLSFNFYREDEWLFHFRVDFKTLTQSSCVIMNSTSLGKWLKEERHTTPFPFSKAITHDILFIAYGKSIAIDVDGHPFQKFSYRLNNDPVKIDRITVEGDCVLQRFVFKYEK